MKFLGALFGSPAAPAKVAAPARQHPTRPAATGTATRIIHVRLEGAHLLLRGGFLADVQAEGPMSIESAPDGVLVTGHARVDGPPPMCRLEIPYGATVDLQIATGGLTVRDFRGTLRARVQSGGVSVEQSEGRFRVVVPNGRVEFERVRGDIDILASNGTVAARQTRGGLQAVSSGGAMEIENIDGPVVARTTNGSIDASDLRGTARLSTRTGPVRVSGVCGQLTVRTQSGDVTLDCSIVAHTSLETYKGNLDVKLGPQTNAHLEAKVAQGVVRAERIAPLPGSSRRTLRSTVGLGQSRLRLASGLGVINVAGPPRVARVPRATTSG
jgi:putative adhesin